MIGMEEGAIRAARRTAEEVEEAAGCFSRLTRAMSSSTLCMRSRIAPDNTGEKTT